MTMVLMEGFSNAVQRKIYATISSAKERINAYREQIEQIMNHEVLGDDDGPAQWSVPMHDNGKTVGTITLDNNRIRLVLENFERLIAISISDEIRRNKYNYCIPFIAMQYRLSGKIMISQMKISFNTRPLLTVGLVWVQLHSNAGCTNCTHLLSSGHLAEYMFKWRNLNRFSQQGFKKFNHVFSTFYFRRTNHGGRRHREAKKSKLMAIGQWLQ